MWVLGHGIDVGKSASQTQNLTCLYCCIPYFLTYTLAIVSSLYAQQSELTQINTSILVKVTKFILKDIYKSRVNEHA